MRFLFLIALLLMTACAAKPDHTAYDRANEQADMAFQELEEQIAPKDTPSEGKPDDVASKRRPNEVQPKVKQVRSSKYPMLDGRPIWLSNPSYDERFGGIGYAPYKNGDYYLQRRAALSLALADLAKNVNVLINNEVTTETILIDNSTAQSYRQRYSSLSRQEVNDFVSRYETLDEWVDAEGGLYIWVALPQ